MARLRRVGDGKMEEGSMVEAIEWNKDGTFKGIVGNRPIVGCSLRVGSPFARSYSQRDWWLTTVIEEILEEKQEEDLLYVKFITKNSVYEFWGKEKL